MCEILRKLFKQSEKKAVPTEPAISKEAEEILIISEDRLRRFRANSGFDGEIRYQAALNRETLGKKLNRIISNSGPKR